MDQDSASQTPVVPAPAVADASVDNTAGPAAMPEEKAVSDDMAMNSNITAQVAEKISAAQNVLVALSSNPSVDEMAAAIGLSLFLDKIGKRATAIYSGVTPNALEFLKPEETFEPSADALQDFVIALNKEKADHLRYKLDGDYVKIYITPYKTKIGEGDLEFSYGDYNVDLVIALDVANGVDLDSALREHGRIMHDAAIINITTGDPGKFGEIEWSDKTASSVSEMIARLLYSASSSAQIDKEEATAFLTGIVAATNRFSNAKTTSDTMQVASKLMNSGANQQLVSKNITPDVDNELYSLGGKTNAAGYDGDPTKLNIEHHGDDILENTEADTSSMQEGGEAAEGGNTMPSSTGSELGTTLMEDLKAAEASLAQTGNETIPDNTDQLVAIDKNPMDVADLQAEMSANTGTQFVGNEKTGTQDTMMTSIAPQGYGNTETAAQPDMVMPEHTESTMQPDVAVTGHTEPILPPVMSAAEQPEGGVAASGENTENVENTSSENVGTAKIENTAYNIPNYVGNIPSSAEPIDGETNSNDLANVVASSENPAAMMAPAVDTAAATTEVNSAPQMEYMPLPGQEILPPPPTPPIDINTPTETVPMASDMNASSNAVPENTAGQGTTAAPEAQAEPMYLGKQPAMQDQVYTPQAVDPGAFKIPGV